MPHRLTWLEPHLPAALVLLFSGWSGTFAVGARGEWALAGHLALLLFVGAYGRAWPDPLGLGRRGGVLLAALAVTLAASYLTSPVPRAGWLGLILLPAFLLVPAAVARCWSSAEARRLGLLSLAAVFAGVAGWSLVAWWRYETADAALPLGHHNLLASWLLALGPLAALPWRDGGAGRALAALASTLGLVALLGTGSLGAAVAVGLVAALAALCSLAALHSRKGRVVLAVAALVLLPQVPRAWRILQGADTSVAARIGYLEAGWRGLLERPVFGWGPGSASWTLGEHLRPVPGVHPPDQVVADVHCLPLQIAYEIGWSGLLLICGLAWVFVLRRRSEAEDSGARRAALAGLAALASMSLFGLPLAVTALPLTAMICIGAVLAVESPQHSAGGRPAPVIIASAVIAAGTALLVLPLDLANLAYGRAVDADAHDDRLHHLRRAVDLDPDFPLYRARLAWLEGESRPADAVLARRARQAARDARGLASLWLVAGLRGQEAGEPWSREALTRACRLSPLGAVAPFQLTAGVDDGPASRWAARALLAEPLLLAAVDWDDRAAMLGAAVAELKRLEGVDAAWRDALERSYLNSRDLGGSARGLVLEMDGDGPTSVSLFAFRRRPWPAYLARLDLAADRLAAIEAAPATRLATTDGAIFDGTCGLGGPR